MKPAKDPGKGRGLKEGDGEESNFVEYTGRTASGMIKDMLSSHRSSFSAVPPSPSTSIMSSASIDSVLTSSDSCSETGHQSPTNWTVPQEIYESQEEVGSGGETVTSASEEEEGEEEDGEGEGEDEDEEVRKNDEASLQFLYSRENGAKDSMASSSSISSVSSSISSVSTSASEEGLCKSETYTARNNGALSQSMLALHSPVKSRKSRMSMFGKNGREDKSAPDLFLQNFNPNKTRLQKMSDPGYFTLRRPNKVKGKQRATKSPHRFSIKPHKSRTIEAEISSPSPMTGSNGDPSTSEKPLIRQSAIRSKRGTRISPGVSQTIPETSYSFEISKVNVCFKNTKMEVPCRGGCRVNG